MEWRLPRDKWEAGIGEGNRKAMESFISDGNTPGLLAYIDGEPAAWCAVAPRPTLPTLQTRGEYRNFADSSVWTIICFYVPESRRGGGLVVQLIEAAVDFAADKGARVVEAYPVEPALFGHAGFMGPVTAFDRAGFTRIKESRPGQHVVRRYVRESR